MDKSVQHQRVHHISSENKESFSSNERLVRNIDEPDIDMKQLQKTMIFVFSVLVLLGVGTGYLLAKSNQQTGLNLEDQKQSDSSTKSVGIQDTRIFKDSAEGVLEKGGIDGEGTHKLIRDGGPSQTAYLVSSVIDLDEYIGKKVKVYGQTMTARKAPWLMDIGKIQLE